MELSNSEISPEMVKRIGHLARLKIDDSQVDSYVDEFKKILGFFEQIKLAEDRLDESFRADILASPLTERVDQSLDWHFNVHALSEAPKVSGSLFQVPRIIE